MKNKSKITKDLRNRMIIVAVSLAFLTGVYGTTLASIDSKQGSKTEMIEMLAKKFNLNESEVEDFIKKYRQESRKERRAEMKARFEKRLNNQIELGKLTFEQKNLILNKREELQKKISQDLKNWSDKREERFNQMEAYREEMREWAENNGINLGLLGLRKR